MAKSYSSHSRTVYANYNDIQNAIENKIIDANDIVFCKDTHEMIIVRSDLTLFPVKSKVYLFSSENEAVTELNKATDTYSGQLVSILGSDGKYGAYVVNYENGKFAVTSVSAIDSTAFDYDKATHKPITNLTADVFEPIILSSLADGIYNMIGAYKITDSLATIISTSSGHIIIVETIEGTKYIRIISAYRVSEYTISSDGSVTNSYLPTKKWIEDQGYVTEDYLNDKLAALDVFTKEEAEKYVTEQMSQMIDAKLDDRVNKVIDERFAEISDEDIENLFN